MTATETFAFCPTLAEMVLTGTVIGRSGSKHETASLSSANTLTVLRNLALAEKPVRTLEVGLAYGGSALALCATHKDLGRQPAHQHTAIDPYQAKVWDNAGVMAIEKAGLEGYFDCRHESSALFLPQMVRDGAAGTINLAYIDGSHLFEDVFIDWYFVARLLADQGVVVFDDNSDPHVGKVIQFVRKNFAKSFVPVDLGPFRADGGHSLSYRVGVAFGKTQVVAFRKVGRPDREWDSRFVSF